MSKDLENNNGGNKETKESLKEKVIRKYDQIKASKAGKWLIRGLKGLTLIGVGYGGYQLGKASVVPTIINVVPVEPEKEEPATEEEKVEEKEETTEA